MKRNARATLIAAAAAAGLLVIAIFLLRGRHASELPLTWRPVSDARLLRAQADDGWLMVRRAYDSWGYAPFAQIKQSNVAGLRLVFTYDTHLRPGHEAPPIVNGRYMFVATPLDRVIALDAVTGRLLWTYVHPLPQKALRNLCCEPVNRGVALYGDRVFLNTIDDRVVALDARSGRVVWSVQLAPYGIGYSMTGAPLAVRGKIIVGTAGGEFVHRLFVAALDARNGRLVWKRFTIPLAGEPGGETWPQRGRRWGGGSWVSGSYDPQTNTLFWGVGNPGPWMGGGRPGKNLYTECVLALDPDSGRLKWYYQFTPHDVWDYDGVNEDVLVDLRSRARRVKALYHPDRNGFFYVLDRVTGRFINAVPYMRQTWNRGFDANHEAIIDPRAVPVADPKKTVFVCPGTQGGKNWPPSAYDPQTGYAYFTFLHACAALRYVPPNVPSPYSVLGIAPITIREPGSRGYGELLAIDVATGRKMWSQRSVQPWYDGVLATAGGLVFTGTAVGRFNAYDARTGRELWSYRTSSGIISPPVSYVVDGKQYVAIVAGWGGLSIAYGEIGRLIATYPRGGRVYVFALP